MQSKIGLVEKANANPSKSFFITMLTRDIDLVDCILDLLDNSVDGINEHARREKITLSETHPFQGYRVDIFFDKDTFTIKDHSGGIPVSVAQDYAFRFGRPDAAPDLNEGSIGLYGIGMKRAIFKMGNLIEITSHTKNESFSVNVNVDEWRRDFQVSENENGVESMEWTFDIENINREKINSEVGTSIKVTELYNGIQRQFDNPIFRERVTKIIARDYAFIINRGLQVFVNGVQITASMPSFRTSPEISPFQHVEMIDGVRIEIQAGLADPPPDDISATARTPDVGVYGWYVVCNDRVVVSADKASETGWGVRPVPAWHPQFIGFMGVVRFESDNPKLLPWKTTKRDVEASNEYYQRALTIMMKATKKLTDYTNSRRAEAKRLKKIEKNAELVAVNRVEVNKSLVLPVIQNKEKVIIEYTREQTDVDAAAEALGLLGKSPSEVGIKTFEYFLSREVTK